MANYVIMKVRLVGLSKKQLNLGQSNKYILVIFVWMLLSEQILHVIFGGVTQLCHVILSLVNNTVDIPTEHLFTITMYL